ncbi:target of Nesh-SH3 isoform X7 [Ascaphus truei]|uniref:target of Nesh-SH3 isoform X7 n=1 Tax=Ascaphus truei TaxID=8439 RepID=UPI003F5A875C
MLSRLFFLLFCGIIAAHLGNAQKLPKGKKLNLKVHINATSDTLVMKFLSPNPNMKLEGFILGYGSNFFSNQYIQWPENGKSYITEVDAESRYLIAVKPNENLKKPCKEKNSVQKPLQLVIGTLTPTSVFLSWGILINPQFDWAALNKCPNDRFYTVRYREKEKNKDWLFQLCPTTEIVIDSLKPKTMYEFGVKDNSEGGIWSKSHNHKTIHKTKENEQIQNTYKLPKGSIQLASEDTKALIPITVVKQGIKNLTHLIQPESTGFPPATEESPVHREGPKKLSATTTTKVPKITKPIAGDKPGEPAELKTVEVPEIIKKPIPVPKGTQPPPAPQTSEEPDIEDTKPVTSEAMVKSFTSDSSAGTLQWVRATTDSLESQFVYSDSKTFANQEQPQTKPVTHPFIPVPNVSTESSDIDEQSQATSLALLQQKQKDTSQHYMPSVETLLTLEPPRETMAPTEITELNLSEPGVFSSTEEPQTKTAFTEKALFISSQPVTLSSPEKPQTSLEYPTIAPATLTKEPPFEQPKTILASERQTIYTPQAMTIPQSISVGLSSILSTKPSLSPPSVTTKRTSVTVAQTSSTPAASGKQLFYDPTTESSLEKEQTHHGLSSILPTQSSLSPPSVTTKRTSVTVAQTSSTPASREKEVYIQDTLHITETPETTAASERQTIHKSQAMTSLQSTSGMLPVSTDMPEVSSFISLEQQKTTLAASEKQPFYDPTTEYSLEKEQTHHGLPSILPTKSSLSPPSVTTKRTSVTVAQTSSTPASREKEVYIQDTLHITETPETTAASERQTIHKSQAMTSLQSTSGMLPVSTVMPEVSSFISLEQQKTTLAASEKQPFYDPTTEYSLEKEQTHHGLPSILPTKSYLSPPSVTTKRTSVTVAQTSSTPASREKEVYTQDTLHITETPETADASERQTIHKSQAMTSPQSTSGMLPVSTDMPEVSSFISLEQQKTTLAVSEKQPFYDSTTESSLEKEQTQHGLPSILPTKSSLSPPSVTTKRTSVTVAQTSSIPASRDKEVYTQDTLHITETTETAAASERQTIHKSQAMTSAQSTSGMLPVSTDMPEVSSFISLEQQKTTLAVSEMQPFYDPTTENSLEKEQTQHGLPSILPTKSSLSPPSVTTKRTSVTVAQTSSTPASERQTIHKMQAMTSPQITTGMPPVSTDMPEVSSFISLEQQKTTLAASEKQPFYDPTTESSLEKPQTHHGLPSILPTKSSLSPPSVTTKGTSVTVAQTSSTLASREKEVYTQDTLHITETTETAAASERQTIHKMQAMTSPQSTSGMPPVSTDMPEVSSFISLEQQKTTLAASEKQPFYDPTTESSLEKPQTHHGLPSILPTKSSLSPPSVTTKRTSVTVAQTSSTPASERQTIHKSQAMTSPQSTSGMLPVSTDMPEVSSFIPLGQQKTTLAASEKQPFYDPTTEYSLEKEQTHHGLPSILPTKSSLSPPSVTTKRTSVTVAQTSSTPASREKEVYIQDTLHITETPETTAASERQTIHKMQAMTSPQITTAASEKQPFYDPTTESSLEKPQTHHGLPSILPTKSSLSPPSVTTKRTSVTVAQTSSTPASERQTIHKSQAMTSPQSTSAASEKQPFSAPTTESSLEKDQTHHGLPSILPTKSPLSPPSVTTKRTSVTVAETSSTPAAREKEMYTQESIDITEKPETAAVPKETSSLHSIPIPSTEAPQAEPDSRQLISEIITTEAPHTYEQEKITLVSSDTPFIPKLATTPRPETEPETTAAYRTTSLSFTTNTPTSKRTESTLAYRTTSLSFTTNTPTSKRTESTLASKESRLFPTQSKTSPMPEATQPTPVLNETPQAPIHLLEETPATLVPNETQKVYPGLTTESPFPKLDPKTTHRVPINLIRLHIFEDPKVTLVPDRTEKVISPKHRKTTESLPSTAVPMTTKRMPINLIRLHIIEDPTVTSAPRETPPTPKPTQSNKMSRSKPAPKPTQRVPINVISLQIFGEPEVALVPNTTQAPSLPKTTQRTESPPSKPVPNVTQKVSPHKTKKPQPTARPRAKPASTGAPKESINPKIPHPSLEATLAPYKLQLSSSRPRTSGRPRSRPAQNGTTQGSIRAKPTGDLSWMTGTIPGGRAYDSTKLLGVSRNISMEQNNTGKKTFSVSSAPLLPVRPTSLRRRPLPPNVTGRPGSTGNVLMPRAPSTARPNRTVVSVAIKTPKKQPTLPPEEDIVDTTVFSPSPKSEIDSLGKTRYTAPHVKYMSKEDTVPCSITESLRHFPVEEATNHEISSAPQSPPSNLTIVTVEGCPSFVILDWEQPDNDTATEYEVISTENGAPLGKDQSIITTNQTYSTVENLKPNASYEFKVKPKNPLGEGPVSTTVEFSTESADPRVSEPVTGGKDAIWTEIKFKSDSYSECKGKQYVKRTWYKKFVGIQLCNSLRYKIYLSNSLSGTFYNIGDQSGYGEDHCQFVDSFLDGRTGQQLSPDQLTTRKGFYRAVRQQSVEFGEMGGQTHIRYVHWYECGIAIPGKW